MGREGQTGKDGISRRDFLDGVAITAAGLAAAAASPYLTGAEAAVQSARDWSPKPPTLPPGYYPPTSTGLTGEPDSVIEKIYRIDGRPNADAAAAHSSRGGPGISAPIRGRAESYDCVIVGAGASGLAAAKFYQDRLPFSQAAKDAIVRIQTDTTTDWIAAKHGPMSVQDKLHLLTTLTYQQYLTDYVGAPEEALVQYQRTSHGLLGAGIQAAGAADCRLLGQPGFDGLGLPDPEGLTFPGIGRTPQMDNMVGSEPSRAWPDGNTSLLRLLVSKLIPAAIPDVDGGRPNQENIVKAVCDYTQLDRPGNTVRIRLNSLVFNVTPGDRGGPASVDYMPVGGAPRKPVGFRACGTHVIMACWNRVTRASRRRAAARAGAEPLLRPQGAADLRARRAQQLAGVGGREDLEHQPARAEPLLGQHVGQRGRRVRRVLRADAEPAADRAGVADVHGRPERPDADAADRRLRVGPRAGAQHELPGSRGRADRLIDRSVNKSGGDFEPARDIHAIAINRWNYGYAHELTAAFDPSAYGPVVNQPQVKGRVPFKNVAIANSDSGAMAYTHSAISEGYRAVQDLPKAPKPGHGHGHGHGHDDHKPKRKKQHHR
jgi:spermidine dehydrogenase